ncbi:small membrane A-kinase anchor protein isoform X1 [Haemorhous mexicanus]|uniref:small membrane A-kinase anchor protein isoform X1 n=1 Tax=Haemorhous mexicanus TaxID=30427 RepID=UPI0028BD504B|nr:small membrane A-kinase anchor protein isoform X1 [Haemorhous mexicanus]
MRGRTRGASPAVGSAGLQAPRDGVVPESRETEPCSESPRREAVCALLGMRGQPVTSRCGSDFLGRSTKGDVLSFENNWSHWQAAATLHQTREPLPGYHSMLLN